MLLGHIVGKVNTTNFTFQVEEETQKLEYVQVNHEKYGTVLCQISEIIRDADKTIAQSFILGYVDKNGTIKMPRIPFTVGAQVHDATDTFIQDVVKLESTQKGALLGKLDGHNIPVVIDLQTVLTKHLAVLAKLGAGKSYTVGVLLEEVIERKVPLLVIDPHGEYDTLRFKTTSSEDIKRLKEYDLKPKSYAKSIQIYGDPQQIKGCKPLQLTDSFDASELITMLPSKLSATQEGILYAAIKRLGDTVTLDSLIDMIESEESPAKWHVIKVLDHLKDFHIFTRVGISYQELVQSGRCSILNMKGMPPQVQQLITYKILKDLFALRKQGKIPPFFCVVEEAHNFCPERAFGQVASSDILRTIASEGRKFGMGIGVISQRPARVDKSVLSQVSTQIILKVTNPNDVKAISNSVEGITSSSEKEMQNLSIGHALITGVVDMPLFVKIRPRMTKHGGESVQMIEDNDSEFFEKLDNFNDQELLPVLLPNITKRDLELTLDDGYVIKTALVPCIYFLCETEGREFPILVERINGTVIKNIHEFTNARLPTFTDVTKDELSTLQKAFTLRQFDLDYFVSKTGSSFDVSLHLKELVKKKYLEFSNGLYTISSTYILGNLAEYEMFDKIEFKTIPFDVKISARLSIDGLREKVSQFTIVKDLRECFLVKYESGKL